MSKTSAFSRRCGREAMPDRTWERPSAEVLDQARRYYDRVLTQPEAARLLASPLTQAEIESTEELVRWFCRRYPTPLERAAAGRVCPDPVSAVWGADAGDGGDHGAAGCGSTFLDELVLMRPLCSAGTVHRDRTSEGRRPAYRNEALRRRPPNSGDPRTIATFSSSRDSRPDLGAHF